MGAPVHIRHAWIEHVAWSIEPTLDGDVLRGSLVVHALVETEEGPIWSPVVPIEISNSGEVRTNVLGGMLRPEALHIEWGASDTHTQAIADFLEDQRELLLRILSGGPGIDTAWRVRGIRGPSPLYKRWAVEDLVEHSEAVIPHLVAMLEEAVQGARDIEDFSSLYSLSILAHLRTTEVHDTLLALARLDADDFESVLGAFLTEQFAAALLRTSGGDLTGIQALLCDRDADGYLRGQAAEALAVAARQGLADRAEVLATLASQLGPKSSSDPESWVWSGVYDAVLALGGVELEEALVEACEYGLLEGVPPDAAYIRESLHSEDPPVELSHLHTTEDVHQWLDGWACFRS